MRKHWKLWLAAPAAVTMAAFGLAAQAQAQTRAPAAAHLNPPAKVAGATVTTSQQPLQSFTGHAPAGGKRWLVSDPVAYDQAVKSKDWTHTPSGLSYSGCVLHIPANATFANGVITYASGATKQVKPCAYPTLTTPAAAQASVTAPSTGTPASTTPAGGPCGFTPTGGAWWAASCYGSQPTWVTTMDQEQAVPKDPTKSGALIFLWGGLEEADGATLLQDVLTWGANGSQTNANIWYVTPWYLWSNTSVTGPNMHVNVADTIQQNLTASNCNSSGDCTWLLQVIDKNDGDSTTETVGSEVPFTLVIGANMEVPRADGCVETPPDGHAAFRDLVMKGNTGTITPDFGTSITNPQCSITMTQTSTAADIIWKP